MKDICMFYLMEADKCIAQMTEVSVYQSVFEATEGDPGAVAAEQKNEALGQQSASLIEKAINAIKALYQKIKDTIGNIFAYFKLDKNEKAQYEEFIKKCQIDPELKGKKVTVKDWKKIDAEYAKVVDEIKKEIELAKKGTEKPGIIETLKNKITGVSSFAKKATIQVALDQLAIRAKYNKDFATRLEDFCDKDIFILNQLSKEVGHKEVNKFKKKVSRVNNPTKLMRLLSYCRKEQADAHAQAAKEEKAVMRKFFFSLGKSAIKYTDKGDRAEMVKALKNGGGAAASFGGNVLYDVIKDNKSKQKELERLKEADDASKGISRRDRAKMNRTEKREARRQKREHQM